MEALPVELIADIMGELDLPSLIVASHLSTRCLSIASDRQLNPWRRPILRALHTLNYEDDLRNLSVRQGVPRQNWIEILSLASPSFLLFEANLPKLSADEWEECFRRRFLPSWSKWKKDGSWRQAFMKILYRVYHRGTSSCTVDENWTKYVKLNRNGSANLLEHASRAYNPRVAFDDMKLQANLMHLETRVRVLVELADVRIIVLGCLNKPRSGLTVNVNAHDLLHPPGIDSSDPLLLPSMKRSSVSSQFSTLLSDDDPGFTAHALQRRTWGVPSDFAVLTHPLPTSGYSSYPFFTPSGQDRRWRSTGDSEEDGLLWVGPLMITAQLKSPEIPGDLELEDMDIVNALGRQQYGAFTWEDLFAVAPWMDERITKKVDGPGLGH
ncbi:hypothetical protein BD626DRAFT_481040 [Schizophyllum amplum]|uniref:F-box domain-containing protein n=1 Tax=Schizophyllum amplum TaxID=97359 RepID=A0A550CTT2_9AGAR|nr:hypothetical protein BD626DRAFT_481040 [Auriculariopsis ampla]